MKNGDAVDRGNQGSRVGVSEWAMNSAQRHPRWRLISLLLASGAFIVGTDSFVIAGLLPEVADSLNASTGQAGSMVTVFSLVYALSALPLAAGGSRVPRRFYLFIALVIVALGNLLTVVSYSLVAILMARSLTALGAAAYTAGATSTAAAIAGQRNRGQAVATVLLGMTTALVLGSPLGTAIAAISDWHMTFLLLAITAIFVALPIVLLLPKSLAIRRTSCAMMWNTISDGRIVAGLIRALLLFTGVYLVYPYLSVLVAPDLATGPMMTVILTSFGIAASIGTAISGRMVTDLSRGRIVLNCCTALLIIAMCGLLLSRFQPIAATVMVGVFGAASFGPNPALQSELITYATPLRSHVVTALFQSVLYLGAAAGSGLGTGLLPLGGSPLVLVAASLLIFFSMIPSLITTPIIGNSRRRCDQGSTDG